MFCGYCGKDLGENGVCDCEEARAEAARMEEAKAEAEVVNTQSEIKAEPVNPMVSGSSNKKAMIAAAIVVIIALAIFMFSKMGNNEETAMEEQTAQSVETTETDEEIAEEAAKKEIEEKEAKEKAEKEKIEAAKKEQEEKAASEYVIPESNSRLLTQADVSGMTIQQINYAKNEIYARHGRKFASNELAAYFASKQWYEGRYEPSDFDANYSQQVLSEIEKKNAEFLRNVEFGMDTNGYQLDAN